MVKITNEIRNKMVELRLAGRTYKEIMEEIPGVTKERCNVLLTKIKPMGEVNSFITNRWKDAEKEGAIILEKNGFSNIINLNELMPSAYWDYLCFKDNEKWLIDITINESKSINEKVMRTPVGYKSAILLKGMGNKWKFVKIIIEENEIS